MPKIKVPSTNSVGHNNLCAERVEQGFLRPADAANYLGVSKTTLYRMVNSGELPPLMRLSPRVTGWPVQILNKHLVERYGAHEDA
ncbi:helix-turn-helix domain-containing protein [Acidithiobacillus ferridurans]|uniref:Helix-turn-helix domain-containing protein n=2 Tax=Acidithiobacillus ferridurans TaxID=1232575 RepID=A0A8X8G761_ACIFI|nr:helix-turn-helix domain-containing protein [Acidithiobacillus ferridurans]MBU2723596.1 helix-turn-helix domain-containing protein [Acidithiobacillus ferridurans]MBU2725832.1 helix-turn-helix domain-containing protein [Acidithiobacillus ferridurans]